METVKCEWRTMVNGGFCVAFALGICAASLVAYVIPHWQALALISCLPHSLGPLYWWFVPESPRWLLSKGRLPECCRVLQRISVINGRGEVTRQELEEKLLLSTRQDKASQLHQVFHYPVLRRRILRLFLVGVGVHLSYGVVTMGINIMPSNYFLSLAILALVQLPGDTFSWVLAEFLGRRFTLITAILLAAVFCFVATFCLHHEVLLVVMTGVVKLALVMSLQILYLVVSELLPTPIRSSGYGIICTIGSTSMIISPFLINPDLGVGFRYWAMLGCLLVSLVAVLAIPETVALPLPQDFLEAEQLGCGRPLTAWIHHWNHHEYSINTQPTVTPSSWPHDPEKQAAQSLNPSSTVAVA